MEDTNVHIIYDSELVMDMNDKTILIDSSGVNRPNLPPNLNFLENAKVNKKFLAAALGNWLEWYDFGVYAAVPKILGAHFFPTHDPSVQIMQSFMAFAAGYVTRPLGGILIGVIGDRIGRKCALWTSMLLMSFCSSYSIPFSF